MRRNVAVSLAIVFLFFITTIFLTQTRNESSIDDSVFSCRELLKQMTIHSSVDSGSASKDLSTISLKYKDAIGLRNHFSVHVNKLLQENQRLKCEANRQVS